MSVTLKKEYLSGMFSDEAPIFKPTVEYPVNPEHTYVKRSSEDQHAGQRVYICTERTRYECSLGWANKVGDSFNLMIEVAAELDPPLADFLKFIKKYAVIRYEDKS